MIAGVQGSEVQGSGVHGSGGSWFGGKQILDETSNDSASAF